MPESYVYIGLGSNLGRREDYLKSALEIIADDPDLNLEKVSSIYESEPIGYTDQGAFLNMAAKIRTGVSALQLLEKLQEIESSVGKKSEFRFGPREIDIDILLYGEEIIGLETLTVPHPGLKSREFALRPLLEIEPEIINPLSGEKYANLLNRIAGQKQVRKRPDLKLKTAG